MSTTPAANFATSFTSVVDTGGKFATGVNDNNCKFTAGVNDTGGKLPPVSTTPAANLRHRWPTMGLISGCRYLKVNLNSFFFSFATGVVETVVNLELRISSRIFERIRNGPNGIFWGLGETDSWKKPKAKNLVTLSL